MSLLTRNQLILTKENSYRIIYTLHFSLPNISFRNQNFENTLKLTNIASYLLTKYVTFTILQYFMYNSIRNTITFLF